jgi:hypothetical protein
LPFAFSFSDAFQVLVEEVEYGFVGANLVRLLREAVALVVEDDVLDQNALQKLRSLA